MVSHTLLFHMKSSRVVRASPINAKVTTVLGSFPASSDPVETDGRQLKQCWTKYFEKIHVFTFLAIMVRVHPWWKYEKEIKVEVVIKVELESAVLPSIVFWRPFHISRPLTYSRDTSNAVSCEIPCLDILITIYFLLIKLSFSGGKLLLAWLEFSWKGH